VDVPSKETVITAVSGKPYGEQAVVLPSNPGNLKSVHKFQLLAYFSEYVSRGHVVFLIEE